MCSAMHELKVVLHSRSAKHCTNEPFMIFKASENAKAQTLAINGYGSSQIAHRTHDSEVMLHGCSDLGAEWSNYEVCFSLPVYRITMISALHLKGTLLALHYLFKISPR